MDIQQGIVVVTIHRADSLVALDVGGTSNPFVTATIGHQSHATPVINGTVNPVFGATFAFTACPLPTILTLKVYNKSSLSGGEDLLGSATVTLFGVAPLSRRSVQLSHGGDIALSQRAHDGCGSIDLSYEVQSSSPHEQAQGKQEAQGQARPSEDLPAFLREDKGAADLTSAYAALSKPLETFSAPPPPPIAVVPLPSQERQVSLPKQTYPAVAPQPVPQQFPVSPPSQPAASVPAPPSGSHPPPQLGPNALPPREASVSSRDTPVLGGVALTPKNPIERVTPQTPPVLASPPPPAVPALHALPINPPLNVALGVHAPKEPQGISGQYFSAADAPAVQTGQSLRVMQPFIHGPSVVPDQAGAIQQIQQPYQVQQQQQQQTQPQEQTAWASPSAQHAIPNSTPTRDTRVTAQSRSLQNIPAAAERKTRKKVSVRPPEGNIERGAPVAKTPQRTHRDLQAERCLRGASPSRPASKNANEHSALRSASRGRGAAAVAAQTGIAAYQRPDELLAAAADGSIVVFQKLREADPMLSHGFENVRDYSGRSVLHIAAWHGQTEVLKILLQASPVVPLLELRALRSHNGNTVLHSAVMGGRAEVVQWLRFGNPATSTLLGLRNVKGLTATECAREFGFTELAIMLGE